MSDEAAAISEAFKQFDTNSDGTIDKAEFLQLLKFLDPDKWTGDAIKALDEQFDSQDLNHDGLINYEEFSEWLYAEATTLDDVVKQEPEDQVTKEESVLLSIDSNISSSSTRVEVLRRFLSSFKQDAGERYRSMKRDLNRLAYLNQEMLKAPRKVRVEAALKVLGDEFDCEEEGVFEDIDMEDHLQDRPEALAAYLEQVASIDARRVEAVAEREKLHAQIASDIDAVEHALSIESHVALDQAEANACGPLTCGADGLYIQMGSPHEFWVSAWVDPPPCQGANLLDMIVCVDVSGSMTEKLDQVKQVLHSLVDRTKPRDRVCFIAFNNKAKLLAEWTNTTDVGKAYLHSTIDGLEADGGTRFIPALDLIFEQCKLPSPRSMQIIFLSDGASDESHSNVLSYLASGLTMHSFSLCSLGFGRSSAATLMSQLSQAGRGPYLFIEDVDDLPGKLGTVWAWAEETVGEGFLVVRGLGGCRVLEVEDAYGSAQIHSSDDATLISMGALLGGQRRTVAMKVSMPAGASHFQGHLNTPLVDYMFVVSQEIGHHASCRTVTVADIPSLFIEGLTGVPIRIHLAEEFAAFDLQRQRKLVQGVCNSLNVQTSAFNVDSVQAGSVVVDGRIRLPEKDLQHFAESLQVQTVETWLRQQGFNVNYVVIPGKVTAQRMMQWSISKILSSAVQNDSELLHEVENSIPGPAMSIAPAYAQALKNDVKMADRLDQEWSCDEEECSGTSRHHTVQLQAAHARCFPSDPEKYTSLLAYDVPSIRASAKLMCVAVDPRRRPKSKSDCIFGLEPSVYEDMCPPVLDLRVVDIGFNWISVSFDGQDAEVQDPRGIKFKRVHTVYAVTKSDGGVEPRCVSQIDGEGGLLHATLTGLDHSTLHFVSVSSELQHVTATRRPSRTDSKSRYPSQAGSRPGSRRSSLNITEPTRCLIPDGVKSMPVMVRTCSVHMTWKSIDVVDSGQRLELEWTGQMLGPHWLVSLTREADLENECLGREASSEDEIPRAKLKFVTDSKCIFNDLSEGIYLVHVKGALASETSDIRGHGKGWVCIGSYDPQRVIDVLKERCDTIPPHQFSMSAVIQQY